MRWLSFVVVLVVFALAVDHHEAMVAMEDCIGLTTAEATQYKAACKVFNIVYTGCYIFDQCANARKRNYWVSHHPGGNAIIEWLRKRTEKKASGDFVFDKRASGDFVFDKRASGDFVFDKKASGDFVFDKRHGLKKKASGDFVFDKRHGLKKKASGDFVFDKRHGLKKKASGDFVFDKRHGLKKKASGDFVFDKRHGLKKKASGDFVFDKKKRKRGYKIFKQPVYLDRPIIPW